MPVRDPTGIGGICDRNQSVVCFNTETAFITCSPCLSCLTPEMLGNLPEAAQHTQSRGRV